MAQTFFFYDLETSGLNPREDRIMQFAGIRTDTSLNPIGEPYNVLIKLNDDTLPSPEAVMVTGITPQSTQADGYTEAEFAQFLCEEIFTADTVTVGFNNVRFDDEFIRYLFWRTFRDPYEWCWNDGCSRWDILDVVRMTRALRPGGIEWPVDAEGNATNRLELITKANSIAHESAHDALSDVEALIDVTKLLKAKQPKLFEYLLTMRDKKSVKKLVDLDNPRPFVYTSGRYDKDFGKTTVAYPLAPAPNGNVLVYDLRHDPSAFVGMSQDQLFKKVYANWEDRRSDGFVPVPVKTLQYNRCPAVAPLGVLEQDNGWSKLSLDIETVKRHTAILTAHPEFAEKLRLVGEQRPAFKAQSDAEAKLYDGFIDGADKVRIEAVRSADQAKLSDFHPEFADDRLAELLHHYKARNYPRSMSEEESVSWEQWRGGRLRTQLPDYLRSLERQSKTAEEEKRFLLEELQLWAEAIMPIDED